MNQRIFELAEQAFQPINDISTEGVADRYTFEQAWFQMYNQKFAELIARRCMDIATKEALSIAEIDDGRPTFATSIATAGRIGRQIGLEFDLFDEDVK